LAESNRRLAHSLCETGEYNWAIVLLFYSALHLVNALMIRDGEYHDDVKHPARGRYVDDRHPSIGFRYEGLFAKSVKARYWPWWRADLEMYRMQLKQLDIITAYVHRVLGV
jgi:hypothetical protein